jgi:hypothetical protein
MTDLAHFFGPLNEIDLDSLSPPFLEILQPWIDRYERGTGPAFLPRQWGEALVWYGFTEDAAQRRDIQDLLPHWIGPARSDAHARRGAIDPEDPFDADLEASWPGRVFRLEVWPQRDREAHDASKAVVRDRLISLARALEVRPPRRRATASSLSSLLDDLDLAASTENAGRVDELLDELDERRLLDAPNTTFVAVRAHALLGRHEDVVAEETLEALAGLRVPGGVALFVARSVYAVHLREADEAQDATALLALRDALHPALRHVLRQGPVSPERPVAVARAVIIGDEPEAHAALRNVLPREDHLLALVGGLGEIAAEHASTFDLSITTVDPHSEAGTAVRPPEISAASSDSGNVATNELEDAAVERQSVVAELEDRLAQLRDARAFEALLTLASEADPPLTAGQLEIVIVAAFELETSEAAARALELVERDLGTPKEVEWASRLLSVMIEALIGLTELPDAPLRSWSDWFDAVGTGESVSDAALDPASDWPPLSGPDLLDRLDGLTDPNLLAPVLGRLRAAHEHVLDPAARAQFARTLLTVLAFSDRPDASIRAAALGLVSDALDGGLGQDDASDLIGVAQEVMISQLSVGTVHWLIDLRGELGDGLGVSHASELAFLDQEVLRRLRPLATAISRADWEAFRSITQQVGSELPPDVEARLAEKDEPDPLACLAGQKILVYSLRERSARQAAARLRQLEGVEVTISSEHAGTTQLAGQVVGADLVVIVTAAAKHAATEFIEAAGPSRLVRVNSAGMSAILTALEEECAAVAS